MASFAVAFHGETSAYRDVLLAATPAAAVVIDAVGGPPGDYAAATDSGTLVQQGVRRWKWTPPQKPGAYVVTVDGPGKKDTIAVHAFVMVPASEVKDGLLNGYRIGDYPAPLKGNAVFFSYDRPHPMTRTLHGGAPVVEGEKWVATKWLREGRFE